MPLLFGPPSATISASVILPERIWIAVDVHHAAFVLVAIGKEDGGRLQGAADVVEPLVGGPVVLFDAIDVFGHDGRRGGYVVGGDDAVPGTGGELAGAVVAAVPWPKLLPCQKRSPSSVLVRIGLPERGGASVSAPRRRAHP